LSSNDDRYAAAGVRYDLLDPLKIRAQRAGLATVGNIADTPFSEVPESRGESAHVIDLGSFYLASIEECLGTKVLVADEIYRTTGVSHYAAIAQDTVAMMVNDLATVGTRPLNVLAYWAVGQSEWFADEKRMADLVDGWAAACTASGAIWGGGETPALKGVVEKDTIDLAGATVGIVNPKERLLLKKGVQAGDAIVLIESSGIHANGISLARQVAGELVKGYQTTLSDGRTLGEGLLTPTQLYPKLMQALFEQGIDLHYAANITGHGWRKLMRYGEALTYRITALPPVPVELAFLVEHSGMEATEAYGTFNMGAGYALYLPADQSARVIETTAQLGLKAWEAGVVEAGEKQVVIEPLGIAYASESLKVRV